MVPMHSEKRPRGALPLASLLVLAASTPACFLTRNTVNAPIRAEQVARLTPGQSSASDAVSILGAPSEVVQLGKRTAYRYEFTASKRGVFFLVVLGFYNEDTRSDRVWLFFDANDVLTHMGSTLEAADAEYAMPWFDVHEKE
jgi:hypothetical protein